ncbi:farnesyl-diphosphate synthase [Thiohalospira halophila DSM 15071]|uniref:Farnesyl-diphosphate synthase n=1 Tax=Thiohalospira halophila DSM 15071 TaxID=1123397 RepID=A0A1I1U2Z6_9GAMM|nr:farnesyl diphosphate synthase [Thiohalospira halophila]SFD65149.1 farnesyl-diphosphate synthase [Thiohalospira halophila DSM 15071]
MAITLAEAAERAEGALSARLPPEADDPTPLAAAMRYAVTGGGKRVRPFLVYAAGSALGAPLEHLDAPAAAVEFIHAYSLVHDDLPAMDDDDLRRGRPTCHRAFDEATAILAGDALQGLAFSALAEAGALPEVTRLRMVASLSRAAGAEGMVGGQARDINAVGRETDLAGLEAMHRRKTGALIEASARLGGLAAGADDATLGTLERYAAAVGLAFQIQDDILDVVGDTATLGKTGGADAAREKPTYPALLGLEGARERARAMVDDALEALAELGDGAEPLRDLARYVIERDH